MTQTVTTLVTGLRAADREAAIAAAIVPTTLPGQATAVLLEGLPSGLDSFQTLSACRDLRLIRIAPGCVCCVGNLTLKVTLNRILKQAPQRLFIGLADATHLPQIGKFLSDAPYRDLLRLTEPMDCADQAKAGR